MRQPLFTNRAIRGPSPTQKALMVTLVPKFNLPRSTKPDVVFIIDRSEVCSPVSHFSNPPSPLNDLNLEIVMTDGQVWNSEDLFKYVENATEKGDKRLFSLGIGQDVSQDVSHALVRQ